MQKKIKKVLLNERVKKVLLNVGPLVVICKVLINKV